MDGVSFSPPFLSLCIAAGVLVAFPIFALLSISFLGVLSWSACALERYTHQVRFLFFSLLDGSSSGRLR